MNQDQLELAMHREGIPQYMRDGVVRYVMDGVHPGDFLYAVLTNDLVGAYGRADEWNTLAMRNWASLLYNTLPVASWGNPERVRDWIAMGGINGLKKGEEE